MSSNYRELVQLLASPVPDVRERARADLVRAGKAALSALVDGLGSQERDVRAQSALCLGSIGFVGAAKVLAAMAESDPDPSVRPLALRALADLARPGAPGALRDALLHHLRQGDMFARALACQGLGRIGDDESRAALQRALADGETWVREAARKATGQPAAEQAEVQPASSGQPQQALVVSPPSATIDRLLAQLGSPDLQEQRDAQGQLVEHGVVVVEPLTRLLWNELWPGRRAGVELLGAIGTAEAVSHLAQLLGDPGAAGLRAPILYAMARCCQGGGDATGRAFPAQEVRRVLERDADSLVRAAAARALVVAGGPSRRIAVEQALADREQWVRVTALAALAEHAGPADRDLVPRLVTCLDAQSGAAEGDPAIPLHVMRAVRRVLSGAQRGTAPGAMRCASYFLYHEDLAVRLTAGELLAEGANPEDVDQATLAGLVDLLLEEGGSETRIRLIRAVGRLARPATSLEAVEALARILHTQASASGPAEAHEAAKALAAIGGSRAIGVLVEAANSRQGPVVAIAAGALTTVDPRAEVVGVRGHGGVWEVKIQRWCECSGALHWVQRQREELRCIACDREYVLSAAGKLLPSADAPLGTCLCPECRRRQPLLRRPGGDALFCPMSGRVHVRPFDHPAQLRLLSDLPLGACSCCAEPQPLMRVNEEVVCYRSRQRYRATPRGFTQQVAPEPLAPADQVAAINEALLAGSIGVGESGLATARALEDGERDED